MTTFTVEAAKYLPRGNRALVRVDEPITRTPSGLYLPDNAQKAPRTGTVVAVGPGRRSEQGKLIETGLSEGDRVVFAAYSGTAVEGDDDLVILSADDVLATIQE